MLVRIGHRTLNTQRVADVIDRGDEIRVTLAATAITDYGEQVTCIHVFSGREAEALRAFLHTEARDLLGELAIAERAQRPPVSATCGPQASSLREHPGAPYALAVAAVQASHDR